MLNIDINRRQNRNHNIENDPLNGGSNGKRTLDEELALIRAGVNEEDEENDGQKHTLDYYLAHLDNNPPKGEESNWGDLGSILRAIPNYVGNG